MTNPREGKWIVAAIFVYIVLSISALAVGMLEGLIVSKKELECFVFDRRIKYVFPAFNLGCWLTEGLSDD